MSTSLQRPVSTVTSWIKLLYLTGGLTEGRTTAGRGAVDSEHWPSGMKTQTQSKWMDSVYVELLIWSGRPHYHHHLLLLFTFTTTFKWKKVSVLSQCFPHINLFVAFSHNNSGCHLLIFYFWSCASCSHSLKTAHPSVNSMMLYTHIQWLAVWYLVRR